MESKVTVIGGGISGLASAFYCVTRGLSVTLVEPGRIGGVIETVNVDGFTLECGPNVFISRGDLASLFSTLGLDGDARGPEISPYEQHVWFDVGPHSVPRSVRAFIKSDLLSFRSKRRIVSALFRRETRRPPPDESVSTFLDRVFDKETVRDVVDPALKGIWGGDLSRLSARSVLPNLWNHLTAGNRLFAFLRTRVRGTPRMLRRGNAALVETLRARLTGKVTFVSSRVDALRCDTPRSFVAVLASGEHLASDAVVVATSGSASARYLSHLDRDMSAALDSIGYAGLTVVHVAIDDKDFPASLRRSFGVLFPSGTPFSLLGVMCNSILFPHTAPAGKQLLTLCIGGPSVATDDKDVSDAVKLVAERFQIKHLAVLRVTRWPRAIPQYSVGHHLLESRARALETKFPGLAFAGADFGGVGVGDRVRVAREKCERLFE